MSGNDTGNNYGFATEQAAKAIERRQQEKAAGKERKQDNIFERNVFGDMNPFADHSKGAEKGE